MNWVSIERFLQRASAITSHKIIHQELPAQLHHRMRIKYQVNTSVNPVNTGVNTRMTGPGRLGPRPREVGRTKITKYH